MSLEPIRKTVEKAVSKSNPGRVKSLAIAGKSIASEVGYFREFWLEIALRYSFSLVENTLCMNKPKFIFW